VKDFAKVKREISLGENVIVDPTNMTPAHVEDLRAAVSADGLDEKVVWYP